MARIRTVKPQLFESGSLNRCSILATLTFVGLFILADDEGRFIASPRRILGELYPERQEISEHDITRCLDELTREHCITTYVVNGVTYGWIPEWKRHQNVPHPRPSLLPTPPRQSKNSHLPGESRNFREDLANVSGELREDLATFSCLEREREREREKEEKIFRANRLADLDSRVIDQTLIEPSARSSDWDDDEGPIPDDDPWDDTSDWDPSDDTADGEPEDRSPVFVAQPLAVDVAVGPDARPSARVTGTQTTPGAASSRSNGSKVGSEPEAQSVATEAHTAALTRTEREAERKEQEIAAYTAEFLECWKIYPRHLARAAARDKFIATRRRGIAAEDLLKATKAYADECARERREKQFVLHGATFYGPSERWLDYLPASGDGGGSGVQERRADSRPLSHQEMLARSPYDPGAEEITSIGRKPVDTCTWNAHTGVWTWQITNGATLWVEDDTDERGAWVRTLWCLAAPKTSAGAAPSWAVASRELDPTEAQVAAAMRLEAQRAVRGERDAILDAPEHAYELYQHLLVPEATEQDQEGLDDVDAF